MTSSPRRTTSWHGALATVTGGSGAGVVRVVVGVRVVVDGRVAVGSIGVCGGAAVRGVVFCAWPCRESARASAAATRPVIGIDRRLVTAAR